MAHNKVTVAGAGNVGAATAHIAATENLGEVVLVDIVQGLAEGKGLDLSCAGPVQLYESGVRGTMGWADTAGSDIVIITSGVARRPGMSRDDLLAKNTDIVKSVAAKAVEYSPECMIIVVANPLDAMVHVAGRASGLPKQRVMGMAGELDCARYNYFIASELGISPLDVQSILMGGHGDDMVPLPRFTSVRGIPVTELISEERLEEIIERTRKGGIEVVNLLGTSAYYAPAAGAVRMAKAILRDEKKVLACCCYCEGQYGAGGYFVGVPAVLGCGGVERVLELKLNEGERKDFLKSLEHVKELVASVDKLLG